MEACEVARAFHFGAVKLRSEYHTSATSLGSACRIGLVVGPKHATALLDEPLLLGGRGLGPGNTLTELLKARSLSALLHFNLPLVNDCA